MSNLTAGERLIYMSSICARAYVEADTAMSKHPQPNYVLTKLAEEAGEVVKAGVHFAEGRDFDWSDLEAECIQVIAMCLRLLVEGDGVHGITPPPISDRLVTLDPNVRRMIVAAHRRGVK